LWRRASVNYAKMRPVGPGASVVAANFFDEHFTSMLNGLALGMLIFVLAVGLSLIFGLLDVLNLAHGAVYLLGTYLGFQLVTREGVPFVPAALIAVVFGLALGVVLNGFLRPIRGRGHLDQVLLTLGLLFIVGDLITIVWGVDSFTIEPPAFLDRSVEVLGHTYPLYRLAVMAIGVALFVVLYAVFERTQLGAVLRAATEDPAMVGALGVNVRRVALAVLAAGCALATFAGVVGGPILTVSGEVGTQVLIYALIVVVIGGLGSIPGAFVGSIVLGEVQSLGVDLIPEIASFAVFGVMALVLVVRPAGLFGR
jgi:branched-subunit amino acid ABC-type transport system permease component